MKLEFGDILQLLQLDKGVEESGPLFLEPQRRLSEDPAFGAEWTHYQALKALAIEASPGVPPALLKEVQRACRRAAVSDALAAAAGDDTARAILLAHRAPSGPSSLKAGIYLALVLGLGYAVYRLPDLSSRMQGPAPAPAPAPDPGFEAELAFEFGPVSATASTSLTPTPAESPEADELKELPKAERRAKRLLIQHLRTANKPALKAPTQALQALPLGQVATPRADALPAASTPTATATATLSPTPKASQSHSATPSATPTPTLRSSASATATPAPTPLASPTKAAPAASDDAAEVVDLGAGASAPAATKGDGGFVLDLVSAVVEAAKGRKARVDLKLPEAGAVELRIFSAQGGAVRKLADGSFSAGRHRYDWDGLDEQGRRAKPGTYYLRVMTRWSSRVESVEVR